MPEARPESLLGPCLKPVASAILGRGGAMASGPTEKGRATGPSCRFRVLPRGGAFRPGGKDAALHGRQGGPPVPFKPAEVTSL